MAERGKTTFGHRPGESRGWAAIQARNYFGMSGLFERRPNANVLSWWSTAQFGTAVWLNGKNMGEHLGCFTPVDSLDRRH